MSPDPHIVKLLDVDFPYMEKSPVVGRLSCVMHGRATARGLELTPDPSRALLLNEIHELVVTDEPGATMGDIVNRMALVAFFEVTEGGIVLVGDRVEVDGVEIGRVAGFDLTHADNHLNVCVRVPETMRTGYEMGHRVGARIAFVFQGPDQAKMVAR